jgi:hypothetical protein
MGKKGELEYGWSRDMTSMGRSRVSEEKNPILSNCMMFNPDKNSKKCTG